MFHKFLDRNLKAEAPKLKADRVAFVSEDGIVDVQALKEAIDRIAASFAFNGLTPEKQAESEDFVVGMMTGLSLMLGIVNFPAYSDNKELSAGVQYIISTIAKAHPDKFKLRKKGKFV